MSEVTVTKNEQNEKDEPQDAFAMVADNSRLAIGDDERSGVMDAIRKIAKDAKNADVKSYLTKRTLAWAESVGSSFCIAPSGFPDWAGKFGMYQVLIVAPRNEGLKGLDEDGQRRIRDSVRQLKSRGGIKFRAVVWHILKSDERFAELYGTVSHDWQEALTDAALDRILQAPTQDLVKAVQDHYASALEGETIPKGTPFNPESATGSSGTGDGPSQSEAATKTLERSVSAVGNVTPLVTVEAITNQVRALARQVMAEDFKFQGGTLPQVVATLRSLHPKLLLLTKVIEGQASEAEMRMVSEWADDSKPADEKGTTDSK